MSKKRVLRAVSLLLSVMMIMTCFILPVSEVSAFSGSGTMISVVIDNVTKKYKSSFELFDRINEYRTANGLAPWSSDGVLFNAAMEKAVEMSVHLDYDYDPERIYDKSEDVKTKDTGMIIAYSSSNFSMFFDNFNDEESRIIDSTDTYVSCAAAIVEVNKMKYACIFVSNKAPEPVEDFVREQSDETADYPVSCPVSYLRNATVDGADQVINWYPGRKYSVQMKIVQTVTTASGSTDIIETPLDESCTVVETASDPDITVDGGSIICAVEKSDVSFRASLKGENSIYKEFVRNFVAADVSVLTVDKIPDQNYTGQPIKPVLVVKHNGRPLSEGDDYTIEYINNVYAGTAKAVITGKGSYKGSRTVEFKIVSTGFSVKFDSPPTAIGMGEEKVFKAIASKYNGSVTYRFELSENGKDNFVCIKDFSSDNTVTVKLSVIGSYTLRIIAKDSQGECMSETDFAVTEPLTVEFTKGEDITYSGMPYSVTAKGSGGKSPYKYALYYKAPGSTKETAFASFRDDPVFNMEGSIFSAEGDYVIIIKCKDSNGTIVSAEKTVKCIRNGAFVNTTTLSADFSDDLYNNPVYFIPSCKGGDGEITYTYFYDKSGNYYKNGKDINKATWTNITSKVTGNENRFPTLSESTIKTISAFDDGLPIKVTATDSKGNVDTILLFLQLVYKEVEKVENESFINADPIPDSKIAAQYAIPVNSNLILYGEANKGTEPYVFKFQYTQYTSDIYSLYDHRDWNDIASTGNYATFCCEDTITYAFKITVTDKNNTSDVKFFLVKSYYLLSNQSYIVNSESNGDSRIFVGDSLEIYSYAKGGISPYTFDYYYQIKGSDMWTVIAESLNSNESAYFKPDKPGEYKIKMVVNDCIEGLRSEIIRNCTVVGRIKNNSTISSKKCYVNDEVILSGSAQGGFSSYVFDFSYRYGTEGDWIQINKDTDAQAESTFVPDKAGHFQIKITAELENSGETSDMIFDLEVVIKPLENNSTVSSELIPVGSKFTIKGSANGGTPPYKYTYEYKRSNKDAWLTIGEKESTALSAKLKPASTGEFDIRVTVQDSNGEKAEKYFTAKASGLKNSSALKSETILFGEYVNITGKGESGAEPYKYNYYYKRSVNTKWVRLGTKDTTETTSKFKPTAAVDFDVRVTITDAYGMTVVKNMKVSVSSLKNESTVSANNIIAGKKLYIYGKASGGDSASYKYTYYYKKNSAAKWSRIGDPDTTEEKVYLKPQTAAAYTIRVVVTDARSVSAAKNMTVNVFTFVNNSEVVTKSPVIGKSIVIKGAASGGTEPYTYSYYYRRSGNTKWNIIGTAFTATEKVSFKPLAAAEYEVRVIAKDANGLTLEKVIKSVVG